MPPKKEQEQPKVKLGRPGNTLKMGIVGLPNVGKSTTFNLLSKLNVPAENYPFCTIDPNLAKVFVEDERLDKLCELVSKTKVPANLSIMDIAGLVPGASKGEGLGNAFLSHIRETDAIYHVVRTFDNPEIIHTESEVDPVRDLQIISDELVIKDEEICSKRIEEISHKLAKRDDKELKEELDVLNKVHTILNNKKWVATNSEWTFNEVEILNKHQFLTSKPVVYLINLSSEDFLKKKNKWLVKIKEWVTANCPGEMIPYSADYEKQVAEGTADPKGSMINRIIKTGYKTLDLIYFFTFGPTTVIAWTVRADSKAPQAAGVIHSDFEKGFISVDIMKYEDFAKAGSEKAVKDDGKFLAKGKDYVVCDGDILLFKFNVSNNKKK